MKRLLIILCMLPLLVFGQVVTNDGKVLTSPYRYIPNDIAAWTMGTGTYVNGGTFPNDYIQCTSAGTMYIPSTQAYGEWYWDIRPSGTNIPTVNFISNNTSARYTFNGYMILMGTANYMFYLYKCTGIATGTALFYKTPNGYVTNTWYQMKVTRTAAGVFSVYIRGGAFGSVWKLYGSLTSGANPVTDNTYTTSNYFVLDLDAGDRIANVRFKPSTGYNTIVKQGFDNYLLLLLMFGLLIQIKRNIKIKV